MSVRDFSWACVLVLLGCGGSPSPDGNAGGDAAGVDGGPGSDGGVVPSTDGGGTSGDGPVLPIGTLLFLRRGVTDGDVLVARTLATGEERIVTDLTSDDSDGWDIHGFSVSPDRRRIALASLYAPTSEDVATGLPTRAIWTLDTDGTDFRRLTPTFENTSGGRSNFSIEVSRPVWTADGAFILYDFGNYWWEGTSLAGGSTPWIVSAAGDAYPSSWPTPFGCSVIYPSRSPATGEMVLTHSVCVGGANDGLYLYPAAGGTSPRQLLASSHVSGGVDLSLEAPSWLADGSGFVFLGSAEETDWETSILIYDMASGAVSIALQPAPGTYIRGAALAPDASALVYCVEDQASSRTDLHLVDLTLATPTDTAITNDGQSCFPSF